MEATRRRLTRRQTVDALAGVTALFSALSYAEPAGMIPGSGSSYSYAYATLGELVAWVCGWCLILECGVSVAAVAVGWGQYVNELLDLTFGVTLPDSLSAPPGAGGTLNIPAALIVVLAMVVLLRGAKESAVANTIMVGVKIAALVLFFSYTGFDAASTAGEEARNPQKDLPRAIILSLVLVAALYVLVAVAALGAMPWQRFAGTEATLSEMLVRSVGGGSLWPVLLSVGAVVATTSVVLTVQYGQIRILFAMARDGLVPPLFAKVHPRTGVPRANTVIVSAGVWGCPPESTASRSSPPSCRSAAWAPAPGSRSARDWRPDSSSTAATASGTPSSTAATASTAPRETPALQEDPA